MNPLLDAARGYVAQGFSVIPVNKDKHPTIKDVIQFRKRYPTDDELQEWFRNGNAAGVAIVIGELSNISALDLDHQDAVEWVRKRVPGLAIHTKTPRPGWHCYFLGTSALSSVNLRTTIGIDAEFYNRDRYIIAPPSFGGGYKIKKPIYNLQKIPDKLIEALSTNSVTKRDTAGQGVTLRWTEGGRDDSLFSVAYALIRGGIGRDNANNVLDILADNCRPEFDDAPAKVKSAIDRVATRERNLHQEIETWVRNQERDITYQECDKELHIVTKGDKDNRRKAFQRLCEPFPNGDPPLLERSGKRNGQFSILNPEVDWLDIDAATTNPLDIKFPFGLEKIINIPEKSVICVAGDPGAGKTAWMLNCALMNRDNPMNKIYLTSEAGAQALKIRLLKRDPPISIKAFQEQVRFGAKTADFHAAIDPNGINFIDYLEIHDSFWLVDQYLTSLFNKLDKGVVIVGMQKSKNSSLGLGGGFSMQKPEVYLTLEDNAPDGAIMTIRKGRWWVEGTSQVGLIKRYRTYSGINFMTETQGWVDK